MIQGESTISCDVGVTTIGALSGSIKRKKGAVGKMNSWLKIGQMDVVIDKSYE